MDKAEFEKSHKLSLYATKEYKAFKINGLLEVDIKSLNDLDKGQFLSCIQDLFGKFIEELDSEFKIK